MIRIDLAGFEVTIALERRVVENEDDDEDEYDYFESCILVLDHHGIAQYPYRLDFDFNDIARFQVFRWMQVGTHAARRARQNNRSR